MAMLAIVITKEKTLKVPPTITNVFLISPKKWETKMEKDVPIITLAKFITI